MDAGKRQEIELDDSLSRARLEIAHKHKKLEASLDHQAQSSRKSLEYSKDFGMTTARNLLILNGGAIVTVLGFLANASGRPGPRILLNDFVPALYVFAGGLICGLLVTAMGYWNFIHAHNIYESQTFKLIDDNIVLGQIDVSKSRAISDLTYKLAVLFVIFSILLFLVGIFVVGSALSRQV